MSKLNITFLKAYEDGKIEMDAFYQSEPKSATRAFNYIGTLEELYISIQQGEIEILEEANQYKWSFLLMMLIEENKNSKLNQEKIASVFALRAKYIEEQPERNFVIQTEQNKRKVYLENVKYKYQFTSNITKAHKMNIHEATVKALRLMKGMNNVKLIGIE